MVNPAQDIILIGLVGAMTLTTALYCVFAVTLCLCLRGVLC
jgi:APA family basic amino acid/polyamine antiporter